LLGAEQATRLVRSPLYSETAFNPLAETKQQFRFMFVFADLSDGELEENERDPRDLDLKDVISLCPREPNLPQWRGDDGCVSDCLLFILSCYFNTQNLSILHIPVLHLFDYGDCTASIRNTYHHVCDSPIVSPCCLLLLSSRGAVSLLFLLSRKTAFRFASPRNTRRGLLDVSTLTANKHR